MDDPTKLQSAVAYLADRLTPGKVKLFKLLYLADFTALARLGRSITADTYENWEMGPVPVTLWRGFHNIIRPCVRIEEVETGVLPEQRMHARTDFESNLSDEERAILDEVVERFGRLSGNQLRDHTHHTIPYRATNRGDTIPYGLAAYLDYRKPTRSDVDRLLEDDGLRAELAEALAS